MGRRAWLLWMAAIAAVVLGGIFGWSQWQQKSEPVVAAKSAAPRLEAPSLSRGSAEPAAKAAA